MARVGVVAYKLELPFEAKIHPVFHISQLKKHIGHHSTQSDLPLLDGDGLISKEPVAILDRRLNKRKGRAITEVLVQWSNCFIEDATWESLYELQQQFPSFNPCGQGFFLREGYLISAKVSYAIHFYFSYFILVLMQMMM